MKRTLRIWLYERIYYIYILSLAVMVYFMFWLRSRKHIKEQQ